jgi:hypothetical protein
MNEQWATSRRQMDQVLAAERAQRQARRRQQPSLWQSLWRWWLPASRLGRGQRRSQPAPRTAPSPNIERFKVTVTLPATVD